MNKESPKNDELKRRLRRLIREAIDDEASLEKNRQFVRLDKADKYYRGLQYIAPTLIDGAIRYNSVGSPITPNDGDDASDSAYDYNIDLIATYGKRWTAVIGQRPYYALKAVSDDPQSEADRRAARQAEIAKLWLHNKWDAEVKNLAIAHNQYKAGTVWIYTPYTVDATFGETEEPIVEEREVTVDEGGYDCIQCGARFEQPDTDEFGFEWCPQCGAEAPAPTPPQSVPVPEVVGTKTYPNGGVSCHVCNGLTVTVPFYSKDVRRLPYLVYEYEEHKGTLLGLHPSLRALMNEQGELSQEDMDDDVTKEGVHTRSGTESLSGTHEENKNRWTYTRYWISPSLYELVKDKDTREQLKEEFPSGMKLPCVEGHILIDDAEDEAAHEVWTAILPGMSDYLYADPVCWPILGHQDIHNDMWNIMVETLERGLPTTIVDAGLLDIDKINRQAYMPQEIVETKTQVGSSLDSRMKTLPTAKFPEQATGLIAKLEESVQNNTLLTPRSYGGSSGGSNMTAEQARIDLQQGLTQIGTPGVLLGRGWVVATTNAVKQLEKYAPQNISVAIPGDSGPASELLDFEALRGGNWHFEGKQGVPQSFAERRESVNAIIKENPDLAQALGMLDPINFSAMQDYIGVHDLKHPPAAMREKTLEVIQQLLEQQPNPQMGQDGEVQLLPSIAPEDFVDDHPMIAKLVRDWLVDAQGRKAKMEKPEGYENVKAYGMAQERAFQMKQMQQQVSQMPGKQSTPPEGPQVNPAEAPPVNQPEQGI